MNPRSGSRIVVAAFGDAGHAFPAIGLAKALTDRGHDVVVETWEHWRAGVEEQGIGFAAAPEYDVFPTREVSFKPYLAAVAAAETTRALLRQFEPDCVITDILTLAPALSAEIEGIPWGTLIPHVFPHSPTGQPPYGMGAQPPQTEIARIGWGLLNGVSEVGLRRGRRELNEARGELGLPPIDRLFGSISAELCIVATFPQLEYPRSWPARAHVTGPLLWEPPTGEQPLPPGDQPLVVVAPSTSQDPEGRLLAASLRALRELDVRVLAIGDPASASSSQRIDVVSWASYARTMPHADLVICHGGHGTLARALASGAAVLASPAAGDMYENAARLVWSGAGLRVRRRLARPKALRLAIERLLSEPDFRNRAGTLRRWWETHDSAAHAAELVEGLAAGRRGQ